MGLIEERRRAADAAAASTRQAEDARRAAQTAATASTQAEHNARANAFQSSAAPQVIGDAVKYLGGHLESLENGEGTRIVVGTDYSSRDVARREPDWHKSMYVVDRVGTTTTKVVPVIGNADGSVQVGARTLSASEARNQATLEAAVETAYQNPSVEVSSAVVSHELHSRPPSGPITAIGRRLDPDYDRHYDERIKERNKEHHDDSNPSAGNGY
jgi:hypothetical protein